MTQLEQHLYQTLEQIRAIAERCHTKGELSSASALDEVDSLATLACAVVWRNRDAVEAEWGDDPLGAWHGRNE